MGVGVIVVSLQLGYSRAATDANLELGCTGSADPYDLLAKVLAVLSWLTPRLLNA